MSAIEDALRRCAESARDARTDTLLLSIAILAFFRNILLAYCRVLLFLERR
jgi:hypothetical protein